MFKSDFHSFFILFTYNCRVKTL